MNLDKNLKPGKETGDMKATNEKDTDNDAEQAGRDMAHFKSLLNKRKLRLDIGSLRSQSAPTSPAANVSILDLIWDDEEARSVKRKRDNFDKQETKEEDEIEGGTERLATKIKKIIKDLEKEIKGTAEVAKERNTKRELKEGLLRLRSMVSQLMTQEAQVLLQTLGRTTLGRAGTTGDRDELEEKDMEIKELKREKAKLEEENMKLKEDVKRLQKLEEKVVVEDQMFQNTDNYENFTKLEKLEWPKGIYKAVFPVEKSPLTVGKDKDILVLHEEGSQNYINKGNEALERLFLERYPEVKELEAKWRLSQ